jgi:CBS domain-containing protein
MHVKIVNGGGRMDRVNDILNRKGAAVHTIAPEETVLSAITRMADLNVGALVVAVEGMVAGIVTERDYLRQVTLRGRTPQDTPVAHIMTRRVAFVGPSCTVEEALAIMTDKRCRHLPVIGDDGRLAGLVSIGDCVRQINQMQSVRIHYLEEYIADGYPGPAAMPD